MKRENRWWGFCNVQWIDKIMSLIIDKGEEKRKMMMNREKWKLTSSLYIHHKVLYFGEQRGQDERHDMTTGWCHSKQWKRKKIAGETNLFNLAVQTRDMRHQRDEILRRKRKSWNYNIRYEGCLCSLIFIWPSLFQKRPEPWNPLTPPFVLVHSYFSSISLLKQKEPLRAANSFPILLPTL